MVSRSQGKNERSYHDRLFGNSETLQDNIRDLFEKLCQGSSSCRTTVDAILRQVRTPGVDTCDDTSIELVTYLEQVASVLTGNSVRLSEQGDDLVSQEFALQKTEHSTQVYPVNSQLLTERFRQRQRTISSNPNIKAFTPTNDFPLALPAPIVSVDDKNTQNLNANPSLNLNKANRNCENRSIPGAEIVSVNDRTMTGLSNVENTSDDINETKTSLSQNEDQQNERQKTMMKTDTQIDAKGWDFKMMAVCTFLVRSTIMTLVNSLTKEDRQQKPEKREQPNSSISNSLDKEETESDQVNAQLETIQSDPSLRNAFVTCKDIGIQHEDVQEPVFVPCGVQVSCDDINKDAPLLKVQFPDEHTTATVCKSPEYALQKKIQLPENIESSISRALASLKPENESMIERQNFFDLEDSSYQEASQAIYQHIGEFDYIALRHELSKELFHSLPKHKLDSSHTESHISLLEVTADIDGIEGLETLEDWRRHVRYEVKKRIEREKTEPLKLEQGSVHYNISTKAKSFVPTPTPIANPQDPFKRERNHAVSKENILENQYCACGSEQRKKRGHVEIQRLCNPRDRQEVKVEDSSRSRKKSKPQIAFGRRVHQSKNENNTCLETKKQKEPKKTLSDRKRSRSIARDPLYVDLHKGSVLQAVDTDSIGGESVVNTLVDILLAKSNKTFTIPDPHHNNINHPECLTNLGVRDHHQLTEDIMHAPMLDITNQTSRNGMQNDADDHDFIEDLINLFPIADAVLTSQLDKKDFSFNEKLKEGEEVMDSSHIDNKMLLESHEKEIDETIPRLQKKQVTKTSLTRQVLNSPAMDTLEDDCNSANGCTPCQNPTVREITNESSQGKICTRRQSLEEMTPTSDTQTKQNSDSPVPVDTSDENKKTTDCANYLEDLKQTRHLLRFDEQTPEMFTSSDESIMKSETDRCTTESSGSIHSDQRMKDRRQWKDFKKHHMIKQRERLYTKHGIFDPLLFTSSEVLTSSESEFSTCMPN